MTSPAATRTSTDRKSRVVGTDWKYAAHQQATSRLIDPAKMAQPFDWRSALDSLDSFDLKRLSLTEQLFKQYHMTQLSSVDGSKYNFVEAFENAYADWDGRVEMSLVIPDPLSSYYTPPELSQWLWGPHGEFTGFAKIKAFEDIERRMGRMLPTGNVSHEVFNLGKLARNGTMQFKCTVLYGADPRSAPSPFTHDGRRDGYVFTQFLNYADYAAWEHFAAADPLRNQQAEYRSHD